MKQALLYENKKNDIVECHACSWKCNIKPSKTGKCAVRKNVNGELYSLVYGRPVSVQIDPIEKKPLYHFLPETPVFSIGTLGCNFACDFCQNWGISQKPKEFSGSKNSSLKDLIESKEKWSPERVIKHCKKKNIPTIAYTYNEPAVFFRYAYDISKLAHKNNINNVYVSNGFESKEALEKIAPFISAMNIDLKSLSPDFYKRLCKGKLEPVKRNIRDIVKKYKNIWLELTTLIIPGENDSEEELKKIAEFIADLDKNIPWHISKFHPAYKMRDKNPTKTKTIKKAYEIGKSAGLNFIYIGNMRTENQQNTYCPKCGEEVINRTGFELDINLDKNICPECDFLIPGVWQNF